METRAVQTYVTVPLSKLRGYLNKNASIEDVNYIEVTDVAAAKLSGKEISPLGKILKESGKKIALKLPETVENLNTMKNCFSGCFSLISLAVLPSGITNLSGCF